MRQFFLRNTIFVIFPAVALGILLPVFVRASLYQPGETLNPDCAPGSPNCGVVIGVGFSQGGNSFGTAADLGTNDNYALNFRANSSTALTILPSGDVGIGTTTPADKLDVNGGVRVVGNLEIGNFQPASSGNLQLFQGIGYYGIQSYNNWPLAINPLGNNVGIGTTTPQTKLSVVLSGSQYVNISGGNLVIQSSNSTDALIQVNSTGAADLLGLYDNNNPALVVKDGGYVGIGTSSPAQRLDVSGRRILLGSNVGDEGSSRTDGTGKIGSILFPHRLNSEEPIAGMILYSNTANRNDLYFGGGVENIPINAVTDIYFYTALNPTTLTGTERMRITSTGRIGIGTSSPVATLSVMGTSSAPTLNPFVVASSSGLNLFTVNQAGYVGIGTPDPQAKLQVALGDILISSAGATAGTPLVDSGSLILRGAYWNGSQSIDVNSYLKNVVLSNTTSSPNSQLEFYVAGQRIASLRNISNPPYPEPARDFRVYGATGVPAIFSLIAGNGTDYADYTYNGADADIDVSTGGLNLRPLAAGASVKVWNSADNVKLRIGSQNFGQALDLWNDGVDSYIQSTVGSVVLNDQLNVSEVIYSVKPLAPLSSNLANVASTDSKLLLYSNSASNWSGLGTDDGGNTWLRTGTGGTNLFVFGASGQMGIGTTNPVAKLDVYGNLRVATGTDPALYVNTETGRVGIDINTPRQQLSVGYFLDLYSGSPNNPSQPSVRGSSLGNLILSASGNGALFLNYDGGTGGIKFHGGGGGEVGSISNLGDLQLDGYLHVDGVATSSYIFGNLGIGTTTPTLGPLVMGSGAYVTTGGVWTNASDRNLKENFTNLSAADVLQKIDALPIMKWNYKSEDPSITHIGPTAQDFYAAFGLGGVAGKTSISTIDPAGVALLGVQALSQKLTALQGSLGGNLMTSVLSVYTPTNFSGDSVGEAKILAGQTSVRVSFKQPYNHQPIVTVTPTGETALTADFRYTVTGKNNAGFTVELSNSVQVDLTFDWHAFASPEARLSVSDGSTQSVNLVVNDSPSLNSVLPSFVIPSDVTNNSTTTAILDSTLGSATNTSSIDILSTLSQPLPFSITEIFMPPVSDSSVMVSTNDSVSTDASTSVANDVIP